MGGEERKRPVGVDQEFLNGLRAHEQVICSLSFRVAKELAQNPTITPAQFRFVSAVASLSRHLFDHEEQQKQEGASLARTILASPDLDISGKEPK